MMSAPPHGSAPVVEPAPSEDIVVVVVVVVVDVDVVDDDGASDPSPDPVTPLALPASTPVVGTGSSRV
jgi:hypothetical protein